MSLSVRMSGKKHTAHWSGAVISWLGFGREGEGERDGEEGAREIVKKITDG